MRFGYGSSLLAAVAQRAPRRLLLRPPLLQLRRQRLPAHRHVRRDVRRGASSSAASRSASATRRRGALAASSAPPSLYALTPRARRHARDARTSSRVAVRHLHEVFDAKVALLLAGAGRHARRRRGRRARALAGRERSEASSSGSGRTTKPAGLGDGHAPLGARALSCRSARPRGRVGVLGVAPADRTPVRRSGAARAPRRLRGPGGLGARARAPRRRSRSEAQTPDGGRAAPELPPQLRLARPPHAARGHHRRRQRAPPARARLAPRTRAPRLLTRRSARRRSG